MVERDCASCCLFDQSMRQIDDLCVIWSELLVDRVMAVEPFEGSIAIDNERFSCGVSHNHAHLRRIEGNGINGFETRGGKPHPRFKHLLVKDQALFRIDDPKSAANFQQSSRIREFKTAGTELRTAGTDCQRVKIYFR